MSIGEHYLARLQSGEAPDRAAIVSSHVDIADLLEKHLRTVEAVHKAQRGVRIPGQENPPEVDTPALAEALGIGSSANPPERIGPYKILSVLGEGGMGVVYMADQTEPVQRRVAVKLIKRGMDTDDVIARFESERQALALMEHPNIARIYDAGATESGRPYFAMELVLGVPITDYCDTTRLTTPQRLGLFQEVCHAAQHAHQKGLIHRDLKPSNILLMHADGKPVPKIIDFGIARATNQRLTERTLFTDRGQLIGTPEYMSPEQAEMSALEVDTRTDVYSLGVLLYELLVGALPFDSKSLREGGLDALRRTIREEEPPKPSTKVSSLGDASKHVAERRRSDPGSLARLLRGDLDWIVMKALEKDPNRRYATASELAADITRHLEDEPVLAGRPGAMYRLGKFVRRRRGVVAAATAVALSLLLGLAMSLWLYFRSEDQREKAVAARDAESEQRIRAERRKEEAEAILGFLDHMLSSADPENQGKDVLVVEVLDHAEDLVARWFADRPLVEASLRDTLGRTYLGIGHLEKARPHLEAALTTRRDILGDEHPDTLASMSNIASFLSDGGHLHEADLLARQTLEARRQLLGADHPDTLGSRFQVAGILRQLGKLEESERMLRQLLEAERRVLGEEHTNTLRTRTGVARLLHDLGELKEAERLYRQALEMSRRLFGPDNVATLLSMANLAILLGDRGKLDEAERLSRETVDRHRRVLGEEHQLTLRCTNNLATLLQSMGKFDEAEQLRRETLEAQRRTLGEDHHNTLTSLNNLALLLKNRGRLDEAEPLYRQTLKARRRLFGNEHPKTLTSMNNLAVLLRNLEMFDEAEPLYREALDISRRLLGDEHPNTLGSQNNLAVLLKVRGKFVEAERLSRQTLEARRRGLGDEHPHTLTTMNNLAVLLDDLGDLDEAEQLYRQTLDGLRIVLGNEHAKTLSTMERLAILLDARGDLDEAERLYRRALATRRRVFGEDHRSTLGTLHRLGHLVEDQKHLAEAAEIWRDLVQRAESALDARDPRIGEWRADLGACLEKLGRHAEAEGQLLEGLSILGDAPSSWAKKRTRALRALIDLYKAWGKPEKAEKYRSLLEPAADSDSDE